MISTVRLQNFRVYKDKTFLFDPGTNLIVGANGVGKTTIIEAIYMTLRGGSWRGKTESVIKVGADWARVDVETSNGDTYTLKLDNRVGSLTKTRQKNKGSFSTAPPLVLFEPEFILTFTSSPDLRRNWLDDVIEQTDPSYKKTIKNYKRALRQRNRLLKNGGSGDELFVWDLKLSEYGASVAKARSGLTERLQQYTETHYQSLSGDKAKISIRYDYGFPLDVYATAFLARLAETQTRDKHIGFTTRGPHREDLLAYLNNELFSDTASRGEVRTLAMALKKMERDILTIDEKPIELFDDAFSELDSARTTKLLKEQTHQRIITSTEEVKIDAKKILLA